MDSFAIKLIFQFPAFFAWNLELKLELAFMNWRQRGYSGCGLRKGMAYRRMRENKLPTSFLEFNTCHNQSINIDIWKYQQNPLIRYRETKSLWNGIGLLNGFIFALRQVLFRHLIYTTYRKIPIKREQLGLFNYNWYFAEQTSQFEAFDAIPFQSDFIWILKVWYSICID